MWQKWFKEIMKQVGLEYDDVCIREDEVEVSLESNEWTYDTIRDLSARLGTRDINFRYWEGSPSYSEWTPGCPGYMKMTFPSSAIPEDVR